MVLRVSARHLRARHTEDYARIQELLKAIEEPLASLSGWRYGNIEPAKKEQLSRELATAAGRAADAMFFDFEDPTLAVKVKKYVTRFNNLTKMLRAWEAAPTWDKMEGVIKSQQTKSKSVWEKFFAYREEALGLIAYLDSEIEGTLSVGHWRVNLISAPNADWTRDSVSKLTWVLEEASGIVASVGASGALGGRVLAYPTETLPGSSGGHQANAMYAFRDDQIWLSATSNPRRSVQSLVHEIGHRVYYKVLDGNGRAAWDEFFDTNKGPPDVETMIRDWEAYASGSDKWAKYGRYFGQYYSYVKAGDPERAMWLEMVAEAIGIKEDYDRVSGTPKKGGVPGLDQLIAKKGEVKVFLHPVTAYSGKNSHELFAETFAHYAIMGPGRIPEIVRIAFRKAFPGFRKGSIQTKEG